MHDGKLGAACHEALEYVPPAVQVAPTWQPSHCMRALDRLKQTLGDAVLPEHELQMALQLAEHLGTVKGTVSSTYHVSSDDPSSRSCFHCLSADVQMAQVHQSWCNTRVWKLDHAEMSPASISFDRCDVD